MKKTLLAIIVCISAMTSATVALAIQPVLADNYQGSGLYADAAPAPENSNAMASTYEQLTQLSGKSPTSAYFGADAANHSSGNRLNQSAADIPALVNSSMQSGRNAKSPEALQQQFGSATPVSNQINLRGVYAPEPVSVALICAGLVAFPFVRRFRNMLQNT